MLHNDKFFKSKVSINGKDYLCSVESFDEHENTVDVVVTCNNTTLNGTINKEHGMGGMREELNTLFHVVAQMSEREKS